MNISFAPPIYPATEEELNEYNTAKEKARVSLLQQHREVKIAINTRHGGFGLSNLAFEKLLKRKGIAFEKTFDNVVLEDVPIKNHNREHFLEKVKFVKAQTDEVLAAARWQTHYYDAGHLGDENHYLAPWEFFSNRADADLIAIIEELGSEQASGELASLKIVQIPNNVEWEIHDYDGREYVAEKHRKWH